MGRKLSMESTANDPAFGPVIEYLAQARATAKRLGYKDPAMGAAYDKQVLMLLSLAYVEVFGTSLEAPDWVPHISFYFPWGSPNPDDIYRFVPMDAGGSYRFAGVKGTAPVALITMRKGGAHLGQINGRTLGEIDLTTIEADGEGRYSFVLSAVRPEGYAGAWYETHGETQSLLYRSRTSGPGQSDPVCTIERLDRLPDAAMLGPEASAHKIAMLASYAARQNELVLGYLNGVRARGGAEGFIFDDQSGYGSVTNQRTLMHLFELAPGEALILETELPREVRYWSVQLYDAHFSGIDYVFRQSSLNGVNVRVDADGRARLVVCGSDPGVANWLDTGAWKAGGLLWRCIYADSYPLPAVRKVKLADLAACLPADTARIGVEERREAMSRRIAYYQTRSR
jgi:hypothetical protein